MGVDKATLSYHGISQVAHTYALLRACLSSVFVSVRQDQSDEETRSNYPLIVDRQCDIGPAAGLLAAHEAYPDAAWLVVAVDMPFLSSGIISSLITARAPSRDATLLAYGSVLEPLCAIWEKPALMQLSVNARRMKPGLLEALERKSIARFHSLDAQSACFNANFPDERDYVFAKLKSSKSYRGACDKVRESC